MRDLLHDRRRSKRLRNEYGGWQCEFFAIFFQRTSILGQLELRSVWCRLVTIYLHAISWYAGSRFTYPSRAKVGKEPRHADFVDALAFLLGEQKQRKAPA